MINAMLPDYLTTNDVARILGVDPPLLRTWKHRGQGPKAHKIGTTTVYLREDVEEFISSQRTA